MNHCVKSIRIRSYSVQMPENTDQNNSKYGNFFPVNNTYLFFRNNLYLFFSEAITLNKFPSSLKFSHITLGFRKGCRHLKDDYIPVSNIVILFIIFKKLTSRQLSRDFESILPKFQCSFRKRFSTQNGMSLFSVLLLTDYSKYRR